MLSGLMKILKYIKDDRDIPQRTIALTFDDGYRDLYNNALPVLKNNKFKSTVFLPTGYVGQEMTNSNKISLPLLNWEQIRGSTQKWISQIWAAWS